MDWALGNSNRRVRKGYRSGSHHLKAFETSLEGLAVFMDRGSTSPYCSRMPSSELQKIISAQ